MSTVNMLDAKTNLSKLVEAVETGEVPEIIIARNGRPVARLVPMRARGAGRRIGVAKGKFVMPESIDRDQAIVEKLFTGETS